MHNVSVSPLEDDSQGQESEGRSQSVRPVRKVLVLGSDRLAFLSVVRSLGRAGIQVHVAWHNPRGAALRSRYVHISHDLPPYFGPSDVWKPALIELMRREQFDLVIPCHDQMVIPLQEHQRDLEPYGRLYVIGQRAFEVFFDKSKTSTLARSLGIPVPQETVLTSREDATSVRATYGLPVVLKTLSSFDRQNLNPAAVRKVRKAYNWEEFDRHVTEMLNDGPVIAQENLLGTGVGVEVLASGGDLLMAFQHERVHEPLEGGGSSYRKSVPLSPYLLEAARQLMRAVDYTGVAMVEFKVDSATGRWGLMEVNARFWGSLPLALACGADFPFALYQLLVERRTHFPQQYRLGLHCRNLAWDLGWQWHNLRADRSDPTLATRPLLSVVRETVSNLLLLRERNDTLTLDDPAPVLGEIREVMLHLRELMSRRWSNPRPPLPGDSGPLR